MKAYIDSLQNGLTVISVPVPAVESATVTVWVKTGSRHELEGLGGISHFVEHMVFKGSEKRPDPYAISESLDALGADFNASTGKEYTNYYVRARVGVMEKATDILSDMVVRPVMDAHETDKERGVILQEIAMYEDLPMSKVEDAFENVIYGGTSMGPDVIGTRDSVSAITAADLAHYRDENYYSGNMLVSVAGGVTREESLSLVKKYFSGVPKKKAQKQADEQLNQTQSRVSLTYKKTDQAHLYLGFPGHERGHKTRYIESVLSTVLGGGMSSRLFKEVREKRGLAYYIASISDHSRDMGYTGLRAGVQLDKAEEAVKVSLDELHTLTTKAVTATELKKAKEFIKGHIALSLESTPSLGRFYASEYLYTEKLREPEDIYAALDAVTANEVKELAQQLFVKNKLNLAIIGPYKDETKFAKILTTYGK